MIWKKEKVMGQDMEGEEGDETGNELEGGEVEGTGYGRRRSRWDRLWKEEKVMGKQMEGGEDDGTGYGWRRR